MREGPDLVRRFNRLTLTWIVAITVATGFAVSFSVVRATIEHDMELYAYSVSTYLQYVLSEDVFSELRDPQDPRLLGIRDYLGSFAHLKRIKFLDAERRIVWSDAGSLIGKTEKLTPAFTRALDGQPEAHYVTLDRASSAHGQTAAISVAYEVYVPVRFDGTTVAGIVEIYQIPRSLIPQLATEVASVLLILVLAGIIYFVSSYRLFRTMATDLVEAQAKVEHGNRLAAVGECVSMIVHDMRNLLASIRFGWKRIGADDISPDDRQAIMNDIRRPLEMSFCMLNDMLAFVSGKKPPLHRTQQPLRPLLEDADGLLSSPLDTGGHRLVIGVPENLVVYCDADKLLNALVNLVRNSAEAMTEPGVVTIEAGRDSSTNWIRVRDTGPGIAPDRLQGIFEPFVSENSKSRPGLGLAIIRDLVQRHGGRIEARNRATGGAEFLIILPSAATAPAP